MGLRTGPRTQEPLPLPREDLYLRHGDQILGIELKVWRDHEPDPMEEGLDQLDGYLEEFGQDR